MLNTSIEGCICYMFVTNMYLLVRNVALNLIAFRYIAFTFLVDIVTGI